MTKINPYSKAILDQSRNLSEEIAARVFNGLAPGNSPPTADEARALLAEFKAKSERRKAQVREAVRRHRARKRAQA